MVSALFGTDALTAKVLRNLVRRDVGPANEVLSKQVRKCRVNPRSALCVTTPRWNL
jgi:hypothetical protein